MTDIEKIKDAEYKIVANIVADVKLNLDEIIDVVPNKEYTVFMSIDDSIIKRYYSEIFTLSKRDNESFTLSIKNNLELNKEKLLKMSITDNIKVANDDVLIKTLLQNTTMEDMNV